MTKINCAVIRDLLPLYADGCCSPESKKTVEDHISSCTECRRLLEEMNVDLPAPENEPAGAPKTLKKGMQKIRRVWLVSLAAVAMVVLCMIWTVDATRGVASTPANWDEQQTAAAFLENLKQENVDGAYALLDMDYLAKSFLEGHDIFTAEQLSDIHERGLPLFRECAASLMELGLTAYSYKNVVEYPSYYSFTFTVTVGGIQERFEISVNKNGLIRGYNCGNGYLPDPDALAQLDLFSEYLWQDYAGCYWDPVTKSYIYEDQK